MSEAKERETIADIVAEKRDRANEIERDVAEKMASGKMVSDQYAREVIAELRKEADRIEAAWKRETQTYLDQIRDAMNQFGHEKFKAEHAQVGNAAAMREALEMCVNKLAVYCESWCEPVRTARAALSAPPRNCDVGTAEEQLERWKRFCVDHHEPWKHGVIATGACNCPCFRHNDCNNFAWGQMPYESEAPTLAHRCEAGTVGGRRPVRRTEEDDSGKKRKKSGKGK